MHVPRRRVSDLEHGDVHIVASSVMAKPRDAGKARKRRSRLLEGFDSLTLDPSPRLRRVREEMSRTPEAGIESAWKAVGEAMTEAMRSIGKTFRGL